MGDKIYELNINLFIGQIEKNIYNSFLYVRSDQSYQTNKLLNFLKFWLLFLPNAKYINLSNSKFGDAKLYDVINGGGTGKQ